MPQPAASRETEPISELVSATKDIAAAYLGNNTVADDRIPGIIEAIHASLTKVSGAVAAPTLQLVASQEPAVPVKRSITNDYLVCLEDGKRLKLLTRYLKTKHNMTPGEYRRKWSLPHDYPMTAPGYSKQRSKMALQSGLGRKGA